MSKKGWGKRRDSKEKGEVCKNRIETERKIKWLWLRKNKKSQVIQNDFKSVINRAMKKIKLII